MILYATADELREYISPATALPADIDRLLQRASELIDFKTFGGASSDPSAAKDATCAQVEYWLQIDECNDITGPLGPVKLDNFTMESRFSILAPRAYRILLTTGLFNPGVAMI